MHFNYLNKSVNGEFLDLYVKSVFRKILFWKNFLRSKKKKGRQRRKRKGFKAETIKRLSPRSKCYCFNHSRASRIRKFFLSVNHGGRHYFSVSDGRPLWNPFRRPCVITANILITIIRLTCYHLPLAFNSTVMIDSQYLAKNKIWWNLDKHQ